MMCQNTVDYVAILMLKTREIQKSHVGSWLQKRDFDEFFQNFHSLYLTRFYMKCNVIKLEFPLSRNFGSGLVVRM